MLGTRTCHLCAALGPAKPKPPAPEPSRPEDRAVRPF